MSINEFAPWLRETCELQEPRPGVWWERSERHGARGDGRPLTQDQTDCLIVMELFHVVSVADAGLIRGLAEPWMRVPALEITTIETRHFGRGRSETHTISKMVQAREQRGGLHSDPVIRMFAMQEFGRRDFQPHPMSVHGISIFRDVDWFSQPLCACGHELLLHPDSAFGPAKQHRCEAERIIQDTMGRPIRDGECQCTATQSGIASSWVPCACPPEFKTVTDLDRRIVNYNSAIHVAGCPRRAVR